jgi:hypothetical protein
LGVRFGSGRVGKIVNFLPQSNRSNINTRRGAKMTITKILCGCAVFVFAVATASAQTKTSFSGTCTKADVEQKVAAGDKPDHTFMISQGKYATKGEVGGAMSKESTYSAHSDVTASRSKSWGVFTVTYDSGDKIFYDYQLSFDMKDGAMKSGKGTYQATGGTGKMKGVKATGKCTFSPGADGGTSHLCSGDYTLAGAAPAAK